MLSVMNFMSRKSSREANRTFDPDACLAQAGLRLAPADYDCGNQLCCEGQPATGIFCICTGQAKEYFTSTLGKAAIIRILNPGDVIGLEAIIGDSTYATTVETILPATAYFIPRREMLDLMRSNESFRLALVKQLSERCRCAYRDIRQFGSAVPARVARFLLDRQQTSGSNMRIYLTREEIAQSVGSTRETISRIVTFLRRRKWISIKGTEWKIRNRPRLAALATNDVVP